MRGFSRLSQRPKNSRLQSAPSGRPSGASRSERREAQLSGMRKARTCYEPGAGGDERKIRIQRTGKTFSCTPVQSASSNLFRRIPLSVQHITSFEKREVESAHSKTRWDRLAQPKRGPKETRTLVKDRLKQMKKRGDSCTRTITPTRNEHHRIACDRPDEFQQLWDAVAELKAEVKEVKIRSIR